jgi:CRISPR system Cascade subunit CasB
MVTADDRAALAALRRSLAFDPGTYPRSFPYVEPWTSGLGESARRAFYLGAGLFAHNRRHQSGRTLAKVLRAEMRERNSQSIEARFLALLDADDDELNNKMRQAVSLVGEEPIDWEQLIQDIVYWQSDARHVQVRWAREFYTGTRVESTQEEKA